MNNRKQTWFENGFYLLIWTVVLCVPLFAYSGEENFRWREIQRFYIVLIPFAILFAINNYLLIPRLLIKKKYGFYALSILLFTLLLFAIPSFIQKKTFSGPPPKEVYRNANPELHHRPAPPATSRHQTSMPPRRPLPFKWGPVLNDLLIALLLIGFNIAVKFIFKSIQDDRRFKELEKQNLQAELNYLKAQINPHFFMNTLNNIHALIDIDKIKAKGTVIELSRIMRYILYDTDRERVLLQKEIDFLQNYISLMRIRYLEDIDIQTRYPEAVPNIFIPPLLLITLVENAFKHGISYNKESFVHTELCIKEGTLIYTVCNSIPPKISTLPGVGLQNLRKRLNLLYGKQFLLETTPSAEEYTAILSIPLQ